MSVQQIIEGMVRVEQYNDQFRQPNPKGRYPTCKNALGTWFCERCGSDVRGKNSPCSSFTPEQRWGEDYIEVKT